MGDTLSEYYKSTTPEQREEWDRRDRQRKLDRDEEARALIPALVERVRESDGPQYGAPLIRGMADVLPEHFELKPKGILSRALDLAVCDGHLRYENLALVVCETEENSA